MENYKNYLKELFVYQMGLSEEQVDLFLSDSDNIELLNDSKNSFKLLYTYPELFTFREGTSGFIFIEIIRASNYSLNLSLGLKLKDLTVLQDPLHRQIVKIDESTYIEVHNGNHLQIGYVDLLSSMQTMRALLKNIQTVIMIAVKLHPETFTKDKIEVIVKDIDFSNSLKETFIKKYLVSTIDNVLKIDYESEIINKQNYIGDYKRQITRASNEILSLIKEKEDLKLKIIEANGAIKALEEAKDDVDLDQELLEEIYNGLYTHPSIEKVHLTVISQNLLKVDIRTKPIKLSFWNFSPENYLKNHSRPRANLSEKLYTEVYNRTGLVEAYYSPYDVSFYINFQEGRKIIQELSYTPARSRYRNPHESYGCVGNFGEHLRDAQRNGNILRFINILMQYFSTTTVGDGAGNDFYLHAIIVMKGDEIEWQRESEDSLRNKNIRLLKLKEDQNS